MGPPWGVEDLVDEVERGRFGWPGWLGEVVRQSLPEGVEVSKERWVCGPLSKKELVTEHLEVRLDLGVRLGRGAGDDVVGEEEADVVDGDGGGVDAGYPARVEEVSPGRNILPEGLVGDR